MGAEGRIPIQPPATITQPGSYFLTRAYSGPLTAITIQADDVELDLNSFWVSTTDGTRPTVTAVGVDGLSIRDGAIVGSAAASARAS